MKFSKRQRLLTKEDFSTVFEKAHSASPRGSEILHIPPYIVYRNSLADKPRLGLSVARRVMKASHDRNRIKRCVREFFRIHQSDISGEVIVRVVTPPKDFEFKTLTDPLHKILKKN